MIFNIVEIGRVAKQLRRTCSLSDAEMSTKYLNKPQKSMYSMYTLAGATWNFFNKNKACDPMFSTKLKKKITHYRLGLLSIVVCVVLSST